MPGQWLEATSKRFSRLIQSAPKDLFNSLTLKKLRETVNLNTIETMLGIGSGNGRFELALMEHYPITVDFIEPSPLLQIQLIENLKKHHGPGKVGRVFYGSFEEFISDTSSSKYDLIFAVFSFYFLRDPKEAAFHARKMLNPQGHLVIVLHMSDSFGSRLASEFSHPSIHGGVTADWLQTQLGATCELSTIESSIPYAGFVAGDSLTHKGKLVVTFFAQRDWDAFSSAEKKRVRHFVDQLAVRRELKERLGLLHMRASRAPDEVGPD